MATVASSQLSLVFQRVALMMPRCMLLSQLRANLQAYALLEEQIAEGESLQRARRERLAGILQCGSVVAIRHSDPDHPEYQYYMARVLKVGVASAAAGSTVALQRCPTRASCETKASQQLVKHLMRAWAS